jgi:tRNA-dihydrouridine synthase B
MNVNKHYSIFDKLVSYGMIPAMTEEAKQTTPSFYVKNLPVYGDVILAPMDGYSDLPFRSLARRLGSAMSYTEFINAIDVIYGHPHLDQKLTFQEFERPLVIQVFDDDADRLVKAAKKLRSLNPDIIDINMGCSAKCVSGRGAGAGLLKDPKKIAYIFQRLTNELDIPITGKIRLGWDASSRNYREIASIIEENGGQLIAVHGRTKEQAYSGQADWDAIGEVKQQVSIPVIGNGDVKTVTDIRRMRESTGCDGVMIARAAIGNPWIFAGLDRDQVPDQILRETMLVHLDSMIDFYGAERGVVLFRKYAARYLTPFQLAGNLRQQLMTSQNREDFLAYLDEVLTSSVDPVMTGQVQ